MLYKIQEKLYLNTRLWSSSMGWNK